MWAMSYRKATITFRKLLLAKAKNVSNRISIFINKLMARCPMSDVQKYFNSFLRIHEAQNTPIFYILLILIFLLIHHLSKI